MNLLARLLFSHAKPLIRVARSRVISEQDALPLPAELEPRPELELRTAGDALVRPLLWRLRWGLLGVLALVVTASGLSLLTPFLLKRFVGLVETLSSHPSDWTTALAWGVSIGLVGFLSGLARQHFFYVSLKLGQRCTNHLNSLLFKQSLRLSRNARQTSSIGDLVNHMSTDSDSVADLPILLGDLVSSVLMIFGVALMLFWTIGAVPATASLAALALIAPLTRFVARRFARLDEEMMSWRDQRVALMSQTLTHMRLVKYFAWEPSISRDVMNVRSSELKARQKMAQAELIATLAYFAVSSLVLFLALAVFSSTGGVLTAAVVFSTVALFNLLEEPFGDLSRLISRLMTAKVGATRLRRFLDLDQVNDTRTRTVRPDIILEDLTVRYEPGASAALSRLTLRIEAGEAIALAGEVGAGKSTLLLTLLGEVQAEGKISVPSGPIGYVPQEAYIINGSLAENIIFGGETPSDWHEILESCALDRDLKDWTDGLRTEIGERGVNLSGGQRQRVSLARVAVKDPELILLDDPLSAVDLETERILCDRLLFGRWADKTRVVATHRIDALDRFDRVVFLKNGQIEAVGPAEGLRQQSKAFRDFCLSAETVRGVENQTHFESPVAPVTQSAQAESPARPATRLIDDEDREVGAVRSSVYLDYIKELGGHSNLVRPLILLSLLGGSAVVILLPLLKQAWLAQATNVQSGRAVGFSWAAELMRDPLASVFVFGAIGLLAVAATLANQLIWLRCGIRASKSMHDSMLKSVFRAPIRFFDATPVGRLLQRFSRDVESVDIHLQWAFESAWHCLLHVLIALILIVALLPVMGFVIAPVLALYWVLQVEYRRPAREIKRLDSTARSPRYAHFKETLQGLTVIRAFSQEAYFLDGFRSRLKNSTQMFYTHYMLNRWFSTRIPLIGGVISGGTGAAIAWSASTGAISPGVAGLLTLYAMNLWAFLNWGVRILADLEARMTSVERIRFLISLKPEADNAAVVPHWPTRGEIEFEQVVARYSPQLPVILKGVSFRIEAGQRVGLVGRTGSGKSTVFQTLYRFLDLESGTIKIDGRDITTVPLSQLRRAIAIVPQDPSLFLGSLRSNLDREGEFSDDEIWQSLERTSLADAIRALPDGLNTTVSEGGSNLSQGQRQLLCLARALLLKAKIVILDEATASVDGPTDLKIQETIRRDLKGVTLLIIAHRLGTVNDADLIIELSRGRIQRSVMRTSIPPIPSATIETSETGRPPGAADGGVHVTASLGEELARAEAPSEIR
jgi:ABC-type multidrug transport system fused ATPase/permease subunit